MHQRNYHNSGQQKAWIGLFQGGRYNSVPKGNVKCVQRKSLLCRCYHIKSFHAILILPTATWTSRKSALVAFWSVQCIDIPQCCHFVAYPHVQILLSWRWWGRSLHKGITTVLQIYDLLWQSKASCMLWNSEIWAGCTRLRVSNAALSLAVAKRFSTFYMRIRSTA